MVLSKRYSEFMNSLKNENKMHEAGFQTVEELMMASEPKFNGVMRCVFKIKDYEIEVYFYLLDHAGSTIMEISDFLNKDRSSIQRSLQTLMDKGMINRKFRVLGVGGFAYIYIATPIDETKKIMERELQVWYNMMSKLVMKFEKQ
ncbi:helix-turn-helix domain-containing protein [Candidatus Methanoperedens nitratireducens]|uniref:Transcriptional regulator, TrmB (Modular protein) n=1 Tax=Candidatus Methanoperedens nitratireducens TaxID=1392998 RepID=A0A284VJJ9_9EURY|nr:helix-turn-helix domain-containing protein [Candidatus Methanoperedens nitroreducens]SNQ59461.1 Transcriptional regulator, TrmB (modular protein) [Candidatus Methanoperedens nitroreducens]